MLTIDVTLLIAMNALFINDLGKKFIQVFDSYKACLWYNPKNFLVERVIGREII